MQRGFYGFYANSDKRGGGAAGSDSKRSGVLGHGRVRGGV